MREDKMRALVLKNFGDLRVEEVPDPSIAPGEVLVRTIATGICGSDVHGFTGENGRRHIGQIMGHESVGIVSEIGSEARDRGLVEGQTVTFNPVQACGECAQSRSGNWQHCSEKRLIGVNPATIGAFAEYVPVAAGNIVPLDSEMPITHGALIEPLAVAFHAVARASAQPEDRVVVIGGGPIGQSVVLALQEAGVTRIVVSEIDSERRALCSQLGVETFDPAKGDVARAVETAFDRPADLAIDAVGLTATIRQALESTRLGGVVCLVGMGAPEVALDAFAISTEERSLVGSFTYTDQDFRHAAEWLASNPPGVSNLISREIPIEDAPAEFVLIAAHGGPPGKVLVRFGDR